MRTTWILSALLCVALACVLLPVTVLAADHIVTLADGEINADISIYASGSDDIMVTSIVGTTSFPKTDMIIIQGSTTKYK